VPDGSKKLLAFLALDRRLFDRHYVAGTLWPDSDEDRAGGCLRTSLWRLRQAGLD
jgi:DNA-binding SARP family transcriptional activator